LKGIWRKGEEGPGKKGAVSLKKKRIMLFRLKRVGSKEEEKDRLSRTVEREGGNESSSSAICFEREREKTALRGKRGKAHGGFPKSVSTEGGRGRKEDGRVGQQERERRGLRIKNKSPLEFLFHAYDREKGDQFCSLCSMGNGGGETNWGRGRVSGRLFLIFTDWEKGKRDE